ncbi:MAG: FAD-binding oxidoreductase [Cyanobacterium sp. T60_A2020_053]|nr:FAD-binding oxidoreductase [Cyanobacterium sp. T60_A2020_053]
MNQTFVTPSQRQVKEILDFCNLNNIELIELTQDTQWQNKIKMAMVDENGCPNYLILPNTYAMLSQLVTFAYDTKRCVFLTGNGSKLGWGALRTGIDFVISTQNLTKILDFQEEDLVIKVQSGLKIKDLNAFLAQRGQFLPIDGFFEEEATVGGVVATANTVSYRQRYGGIRDLVLGISVVRSDGEIVKAGGKVVKNVAGYDLMKLFTGSYGSLGVIADVTFRLYPMPADSQTIIVFGDNLVELRKKIVNSGLTPTMADWLSAPLTSKLNLGNTPSMALRFQSITPSVEQQIKQIQQWNNDYLLLQGEKETQFWRGIKEMVEGAGILCKCGILPSEISDFYHTFSCLGLINISSGVGYLGLATDTRSHQIRQIRAYCEEREGYLSVLRAPDSLKKQVDEWGYIGNGLTVMKKLKEKFDPQSVFTNRLF